MTDFLQLCNDYQIEHQDPVDDWVQINCPFHDNGSRGFKGGFNISGGFYNCWVCGGHKCEEILMEVLNIQFHEAHSILEQYSNYNILLKKEKKKQVHAFKIELPINELNERCRKYLIGRNFDPDYIQEKYHVAGSIVSGEWAGRLIIPIYFENRLVSFQGRALLNKKKCTEMGILRYKTLANEKSLVDPKNIFYNMDNCRNDFVVVTEGPFDVWRYGDDCMATLGTSFTEEQALLISKKYKKVFIVFDPEQEAQTRAVKLGQLVAGFGIDVEIINTGKKYDLGDYTEKEISILKKELCI